jgi:hypothetical protein
LAGLGPATHGMAAGDSRHTRDLLLTQEDERLRLIVANFVVPAARVRIG